MESLQTEQRRVIEMASDKDPRTGSQHYRLNVYALDITLRP